MYLNEEKRIGNCIKEQMIRGKQRGRFVNIATYKHYPNDQLKSDKIEKDQLLEQCLELVQEVKHMFVFSTEHKDKKL